jgi:hypothetical protein
MTTSLKTPAGKTIRVGKSYPYRSRVHEGTARVEAIKTKATGAWVTLFDKARCTTVTVRPSQVLA